MVLLEVTLCPADLIRVVVEFEEQREDKKPLYVNSRNTYLEKYTHEINYKRLIEIYDNALSKVS